MLNTACSPIHCDSEKYFKSGRRVEYIMTNNSRKTYENHEEKLLSNVHPLDWKNPEPEDKYDLVVIGAGSAGLVAAIGGARLGARTAIIEKGKLGGDCLNYGCVPSKLLIRSARAYHEATNAGHLGININSASIDFPAVMQRLENVRADISKNDSAERLQNEGVDVFFGEAHFTSEDSIEVEDLSLKFKRAIIATGAKARIPSLDGLEESGFLTNETIFDLQSLPETLMIMGGGPLGCELAQAFNRLGSQVYIVQRGSQFLKREDPDAAAIIAETFKKEGIKVLFSTETKKVTAAGAGRKSVTLSCNGEDSNILVDSILVAAGREPDLSSLTPESAGVEHDKRSGLIVDDHLRTTNPRIYAAGDICLKYKFTHTADASARIALQNALFGNLKKLSSLTIPWCTYTDPEVAHVGIYEKEAREKGLDFETIVLPMKDVDRPRLEGQENGMLKIVYQRKKGIILGATLVASNAGDMISEISVAIDSSLPLGKLANVIHPYPTQSEIFKKAADVYNGKRLTPFVKKLLNVWMRSRK